MERNDPVVEELVKQELDKKMERAQKKWGDEVLSIKTTTEEYEKIYDKKAAEVEDLQPMLENQYKDIINILKYYVDLPEDYYKLLAIWIIGTYGQQSFNSYPFLFLNAMKGSGKTRTLRLISYLSDRGNGQVQSGITDSSFFRAEKGATLVLDECESLVGKDKQTLREYLQASYKKGATVSRTKKVKGKEGEDFEIQYFEPYRPIAMANIAGMDEVLGDRCLTLILEKSANPLFSKKIEDFDENEEIKRIKANFSAIKCIVCSVWLQKKHDYTWNKFIDVKYTTTHTTTHTHYTHYTQLYPQLHEIYTKLDALDIDGRNLELIYPLLIIANDISKEAFEDMLLITKKIISLKKDDEFADDDDVAIIDFVSKMEDANLAYFTTNTLCEQYKTFAGKSADYINNIWFGKALKRLNLILNKRRSNRGNEVMLDVLKAKEKIKIFKDPENDTTKL